MWRPGLDVWRWAEVFRLAIPDRAGRGRAGDRLGMGTGASLEFQDRRPYASGDDVRHLDWRTMARTGESWVKVYREEISPRVEVLLDVSKSMATDAAKAQRSVDVAGLVLRAARAEGFSASLLLLGDRPAPMDPSAFEGRGVDLAAVQPLTFGVESASSWLLPGAIRYAISDFLSPHDAPALVRRLAARAGFLGLIQVLSRDDAEPEVGGAFRLTDAETKETLDRALDEAAVRRYRERLAAMSDALDCEARRLRGVFVSIPAAESFEETCRRRLLASGLLTVA